ncbi:hypothetical protein F8M41_000933 [Gigaspora margarita]|uniref:Uncharacterized protein n=1 Tax=Gigaspora margarita TaxID=4874 RepID=A0A8H3XF69_GIGMA|nr:hypothetical protein F8M41_000933 [Gigaspora margarita]
MTSQTTGTQLLRQQNNGGQSQNNNNRPQRSQIISNTIVSIDTQQHIDLLEGTSFNTMQNEIPSQHIKFSSALFSGFSFT